MTLQFPVPVTLTGPHTPQTRASLQVIDCFVRTSPFPPKKSPKKQDCSSLIRKDFIGHLQDFLQFYVDPGPVTAAACARGVWVTVTRLARGDIPRL